MDFDRELPPEPRDLDLQRLVGLTMDDARTMIEACGGRFRAVGSDDDQGLPTEVTLDFLPNRVTVIVKGGHVIGVIGRG